MSARYRGEYWIVERRLPWGPWQHHGTYTGRLLARAECRALRARHRTAPRVEFRVVKFVAVQYEARRSA